MVERTRSGLRNPDQLSPDRALTLVPGRQATIVERQLPLPMKRLMRHFYFANNATFELGCNIR
jgi:hypothetical protein